MKPPLVLDRGEGESMTLFGNALTIKADAASTGSAFCLVDYTAVAGFSGPPPHVHHETTDMFFVLEGELTVLVGDETRKLGPGSFALAPPGTVHTFSNPGEEPVRFLSMMTPDGFEQYFRDVRDMFGDDPPDFAVMAELAAKYDVETVVER
jgi:mannose-6-phosphate isomerase-like protein (cupin superfamily)